MRYPNSAAPRTYSLSLASAEFSRQQTTETTEYGTETYFLALDLMEVVRHHAPVTPKGMSCMRSSQAPMRQNGTAMSTLSRQEDSM